MRVEGCDPGIDRTQGEGEKYLGGREKIEKRREEGRREVKNAQGKSWEKMKRVNFSFVFLLYLATQNLLFPPAA